MGRVRALLGWTPADNVKNGRGVGDKKNIGIARGEAPAAASSAAYEVIWSPVKVQVNVLVRTIRDERVCI